MGWRWMGGIGAVLLSSGGCASPTGPVTNRIAVDGMAGASDAGAGTRGTDAGHGGSGGSPGIPTAEPPRPCEDAGCVNGRILYGAGCSSYSACNPALSGGVECVPRGVCPTMAVLDAGLAGGDGG